MPTGPGPDGGRAIPPPQKASSRSAVRDPLTARSRRRGRSAEADAEVVERALTGTVRCINVGVLGGDEMSASMALPSERPAATTIGHDRDEDPVASLIDALSRDLERGRVRYWASYVDDRAVDRYSLVADASFALLSDENAASRRSAIRALEIAIERYRSSLAVRRR
jgi:hypothetical protein